MRAPVVILPCSQQGGLPRPLRRARQGLDRPRRGPLADAVLAHGRRDGEPADPADRRRRGLGACFFGIPPDARRRGARGVRRSPTTSTRSASITIGPPADGHRRCRVARPGGGARRWRTSCIAGAGDTGPVHRRAAPRSTTGPDYRVSHPSTPAGASNHPRRDAARGREAAGAGPDPDGLPPRPAPGRTPAAFDAFLSRAARPVPAAARAARADPRRTPTACCSAGPAPRPSARSC